MFRKYFYLTTALIVLSALSSLAISVLGTAQANTRDASLSDTTIGQTVTDFSLPDTKGVHHSLESMRGKNGTVFIFISVQCPISNAYNQRIEKLALEYRDRGINVIGINSNATESIAEVKHHASTNQLTFLILKDKGNKIADLLGAQHTPEAFLLDSSNKLVYHGRIDNAKSEDMVNSSDLRNAMDEVLAGKAVTKNEARAFGCSIKRAS